MIRNRNGLWMDPRFQGRMKLNLQQFAEGGADGAEAGTTGDGGTGADANTSVDGNNSAENGDADDGQENSPSDALNAEIARLKAEMAKQKAALDRATHEASVANKALKAKMTAEEIAANEKQEADEAQKNRIAELERQVARTDTIKSVMGTLALDEETSGNFADCLYGAADIKNALLLFQKVWKSKEAALRKEYGKVTGPGAGADSNSPENAAIRRASEFGKARNAQNEKAQKALDAYMR